MAQKLAFINNKGGSGKTTTVVNLAGAIHRLYPEKKILIFDMDAQGNAGRAFGIDVQQDVDDEKTTYQILSGMITPEEAVIKNVANNQNIDLIPANSDLNFLERDAIEYISSYLINSKITTKDFNFNKFYFDQLEDKIDNIDQQYDFIFFDTPPELKSVTSSVLSVANTVMIPFEADAFSLDGVRNIIDRIGQIKESFNPNLKIGGFIVNKYQGQTKVQPQFVRALATYANVTKIPFMKHKIPSSIHIQETNGDQPATLLVKDIKNFNKDNKAIKSYFDLAQELIQRNIINI